MIQNLIYKSTIVFTARGHQSSFSSSSSSRFWWLAMMVECVQQIWQTTLTIIIVVAVNIQKKVDLTFVLLFSLSLPFLPLVAIQFRIESIVCKYAQTKHSHTVVRERERERETRTNRQTRTYTIVSNNWPQKFWSVSATIHATNGYGCSRSWTSKWFFFCFCSTPVYKICE